MKRITGPGVVLRYDGELHEVIGIAEGRTIHLRSLERGPCEACGRQPDVEILEHAPNLQDHVEPVETLQDDTP